MRFFKPEMIFSGSVRGNTEYRRAARNRTASGGSSGGEEYPRRVLYFLQYGTDFLHRHSVEFDCPSTGCSGLFQSGRIILQDLVHA